MLEGEEHVYRFVAEDAGTYWYHSHQVSHEQVRRGLLGALVIHPEVPDPERRRTRSPSCTGTPTGRRSTARRARPPSTPSPARPVRLRVVNTDNGAGVAVGHRGAVPGRSPSTAGTSTSPARSTTRSTACRPAAASTWASWCPRTGSGSTSAASTALVFGDDPDRRRRATGAEGVRGPADLRRAGRDRLRRRRRRTGGSTTGSAGAPASWTAGRACWWTINGHLFPDVADVHGQRGRRRRVRDRQRQRRQPPDAPARPPRGRALP